VLGLKIVGGTPVPGGVCASKPWSFSSACTNLSRQRPLAAEIWPFKEVEFGWVIITSVSSVSSGPKFTKFSSPNVGGSVVDNAVFRLSIYSSVPEIFLWKSVKLSEIAPHFERFQC